MSHRLFAVIAAAFLAACGEGTYPELSTVQTSHSVSEEKVSYNVFVKIGDAAVKVESDQLFIRTSVDGFVRHELKVNADQNYPFIVTLASGFAGTVTISVENQLRILTYGVEVVFDTTNACRGHVDFSVTLPLNLHKCEPEVIDPENNPQTHTTSLVSLEESWMSSCDSQTVNNLTANAKRMGWITVDMDHLSDSNCRAIVKSMRQASKIKTHCYLNPQEFFTDHPERVWQHSLRTDLVNNHSDFKLMKLAGGAASVWPGMEMNDLTMDAYVEWLATQYAMRMSDPEISAICDGLHLDNMNYIMSWIVDYLGALDAVYSNVWDFDVRWAAGLTNLVSKLRSKIPGKEISCRSKSHKFGKICDMVLFEGALQLSNETNIPGGLFGRMWQAWMMQQSGTKVAINHHMLTAEPNKLPQEVETGYAAALVLGADYSFDQQGPNGHGYFIMYDVLKDDLGQPKISTKWPYVTKYDVGNFSLTAGSKTIGAVNESDIIAFWRELKFGTFETSVMTGVGDGDPRWNVGPFVGNLTLETLVIGIYGAGTLDVERLKVYDTNDPASTGYFYRLFERGEAFLNVTNRDLEAKLENGKTVVIPASKGCVVYWASPKTTCSLH